MFSARAAPNSYRTLGDPHANLAIAVGDNRKRAAARRRYLLSMMGGSLAG
jgi:hypothetical protein